MIFWAPLIVQGFRLPAKLRAGVTKAGMVDSRLLQHTAALPVPSEREWIA